MKKKISDLAFISAIVIIVSIVLSTFLSGCNKPLDEMYETTEYVAPITKSAEISIDSLQSVSVDSVEVSEWHSEDAGSVVFE